LFVLFLRRARAIITSLMIPGVFEPINVSIFAHGPRFYVSKLLFFYVERSFSFFVKFVAARSNSHPLILNNSGRQTVLTEAEKTFPSRWFTSFGHDG